MREVIRLLEKDGWQLVRIRGSHRQYKHREKQGRVTVAGKLNADLARGTLNSLLARPAWLRRDRKESPGGGAQHA